MTLKSKQLLVGAFAPTPPPAPPLSRARRHVANFEIWRRECLFVCLFFVKNDIGAESVNKRGNDSNNRNSKGKKEGIMHLLMASFRALPLDLMMPVSRRRRDWIFFLVYLSSFLFFLSSFSLTFSIPTLYLSSIASLYTFAHAHIVMLARSK